MTHKKQSSLLIKLLQDGEFHSGESLGGILGVSRAAVWKQLKGLDLIGIKVESVKGMGYRLQTPFILLDRQQIEDGLRTNIFVRNVTVLDEIDSTNAELLRRLSSNVAEAGCIVLSESQSSGRGRRGRKWVSTFGKGLNFSMSWSFYAGASSLDGLSLLVGISVVKVLESIGVSEARLKWPNDIFVRNRKLAGILLEITGEPTGFCHVVIGIGLNIFAHDSVEFIDQPWISLDQIIGKFIDRNQLVVLLVSTLVSNLNKFEISGFAPFVSQWMEHDGFCGQEVFVIVGEKSFLGIAKGVTDSGELKLETSDGVCVFNGGEVSLRKKL